PIGCPRFRRKIHVVTILRDKSRRAEHAIPAHLDASVCAGQIYRLGRGRGGRACSHEAQSQRYSSHQGNSITSVKMNPTKRVTNNGRRKPFVPPFPVVPKTLIRWNTQLKK